MSTCYFGAESCRHGHTADCPARDGDPWAFERKPRQPEPPPLPPIPHAVADTDRLTLGSLQWVRLPNGTWTMEDA